MLKIELNNKFREALAILEDTSDSVFITGKAGTGKSTLLTYFRETTKKQVVVLAPTGVSALNVRGETIHSFFKFKPNITVEKAQQAAAKIKRNKLYKNIETIIIDEISMVRADLLDCVDVFLRNVLHSSKPFGGVQMIFIGDLYQLPPVVTSQEMTMFQDVYESPFFFSANVVKSSQFDLCYLELEKIYRQSEGPFIELLNAVRCNAVTTQQLAKLNERLDINCAQTDKGYIYLTTTNRDAQVVNSVKLAQLRGGLRTFLATVDGQFDPKIAPTEIELQIKSGAQIMFLNNDAAGRWVNGTLGEVVDILSEEMLVLTEEKGLVTVKPHKWDMYRYHFNAVSNSLDQDSVGSFTHYPLKLAWAVTIHKGQGKTFDKVIIDLGRGAFAHGQTYVALSRCRTFEGLKLKTPLKKSHVIMDERVVNYLAKWMGLAAEEPDPITDKIYLIKKAIEQNMVLKIIYLKANNQKSQRIVSPVFVGQLNYRDTRFFGLKAFCHQRQETRFFRIDRIIEIDFIDD